MFIKNNMYLMLAVTFISLSTSTAVFTENVSAEQTSTEISESTTITKDSTTQNTMETASSSSNTKETVISSDDEANQVNSVEQTSPVPTTDNEEELRKQFEADSRSSVMSFEEYKSFIETLKKLTPTQSDLPAARAFSAGTQRDQIVAEAKKHLGKPYTQKHPDRLGPNKFDCSGLTRYVFLQVTGKNIGDWTVPQEKSGTKVAISKATISQLQPGDLLFWGNAGATYHVAIYIGNGQYIHAPNYDTTVEVSQIWWSEFPPSFALKMNLSDPVPQGEPINDGSYVTITKKGYDIYNSFDWSIKTTSDKILNNTYQAKVKYNHSNGITYFSLYDSNGTWQGYVNSKAVEKGTGKQGAWMKNDDFVTVIKKGGTIWSNIDDFSSVKGSTTSLYQKTYHAQGRYNHFSGQVYYSLYDSNGAWQGFINKRDVERGAGKQGAWMKNDDFVTVTKNGGTIWSNIDDFSSVKGSTTSLYQKTYHAQGRYNHFSGQVYYSLYDNNGAWQGFINKRDVERGAGKQGAWMKNDDFVTVTKNGGTIWSNIDDFSSVKGSTTSLYQKTYHAQGRYNHFSGQVYYSLYDSNGAWQGFINKRDVERGAGKQGAWMKNDDFVTVTKNGGTIWSNIDDFSSVKGSTTSLYQKTYHAQGRYNHFSGQVYYSLYDNNGAWQGFINKRDVERGAGKQGAWMKNDDFVTVIKNGGTIWSNIDDFSSVKGSTTSLYQKTYHAQGRYNHFSGQVYYSLYDSKGIWQGFINKRDVERGAGKQGAWISNNEQVTIAKKDYTIWGDINTFSSKKGTTNNIYKKVYHAQGRYNHFSGTVYYSLYDNNKKWIGFINKTGVSVNH